MQNCSRELASASSKHGRFWNSRRHPRFWASPIASNPQREMTANNGRYHAKARGARKARRMIPIPKFANDRGDL
jgi:hypothetical protein